jgi:hypothetical protein
MIEPTRPVDEMVVSRIPSTQNANGDTSDMRTAFFAGLTVNNLMYVFFVYNLKDRFLALFGTHGQFKLQRNLFLSCGKIMAT